MSEVPLYQTSLQEPRGVEVDSQGYREFRTNVDIYDCFLVQSSFAPGKDHTTRLLTNMISQPSWNSPWISHRPGGTNARFTVVPRS